MNTSIKYLKTEPKHQMSSHNNWQKILYLLINQKDGTENDGSE